MVNLCRLQRSAILSGRGWTRCSDLCKRPIIADDYSYFSAQQVGQPIVSTTARELAQLGPFEPFRPIPAKRKTNFPNPADKTPEKKFPYRVPSTGFANRTTLIVGTPNGQTAQTSAAAPWGEKAPAEDQGARKSSTIIFHRRCTASC